MRHVVALDAQRRLRKLQCVLQLGQGPTSRIVVTRSTHPVPHKLFSSIMGHRLEQLPTITTLRNPDRNLRTSKHCKPLFIERNVIGHRRHQHLLGYPSWWLIAIHRLHHPADKRTIGEFFNLVEHEPLAAHNPSTTHEEHLHRCLQLVIGDTNDVEIFTTFSHHLLTLNRSLDRLEPITQPCRFFKLKGLRGITHLIGEPGHHLIGVTTEKATQFVHHRLVVVC